MSNKISPYNKPVHNTVVFKKKGTPDAKKGTSRKGTAALTRPNGTGQGTSRVVSTQQDQDKTEMTASDVVGKVAAGVNALTQIAGSDAAQNEMTASDAVGKVAAGVNALAQIADSDVAKNEMSASYTVGKVAAGAKALKNIAESDVAQNVVNNLGCLESIPYCGEITKAAKCIFCFCLKRIEEKKRNQEDSETQDSENEEDNGDENIPNEEEKVNKTPNIASLLKKRREKKDNSVKVHFVQSNEKQHRPAFTVTIQGTMQELDIKEEEEKTVTISYV